MDEGLDLLGPVMLVRDEEGRLSARVDGVEYVLLARRGEQRSHEARLDALKDQINGAIDATQRPTQAVAAGGCQACGLYSVLDGRCTVCGGDIHRPTKPAPDTRDALDRACDDSDAEQDREALHMREHPRLDKPVIEDPTVWCSATCFDRQTKDLLVCTLPLDHPGDVHVCQADGMVIGSWVERVSAPDDQWQRTPPRRRCTDYPTPATWRADMDRIAEAVGYDKGADYGDILGKIDELRAELQALRDISVHAWEYVDGPQPGSLTSLKASLDDYNVRFLPDHRPETTAPGETMNTEKRGSR